MLNTTQRWMTCELDSKIKEISLKATVRQTNNSKAKDVEKEFSKLFVWFVAVISLCGISLLANLFLIYLACNQATRRAVWTYRRGEQELLFSGDDDDDAL